MKRIGLLVAFVVSAWSVCPTAEACEPLIGPTHHYPSDGVLPQNGVIVLVGYGMEPDDFNATLDGEPIELEVVERFTGHSTEALRDVVALRPVTLPAEGSVLALRFCQVACDPPLEFSVVEADLEPPEALDTAWFDLHDLPADCGYSSCRPGDPELAHWLHVEGLEADEGSPVFVVVKADAAPYAPLAMIDLRAGDEDEPIAFRPRYQADLFGGEPPETSFCFQVRVFDLAGNEAVWGHELCTPCHVRADSDPAYCFLEGYTDEPTWTDDDLFVAGSCQGPQVAPLPALPAQPSDAAGGSDTGEMGSSTGDDAATTSGMPSASSDGADESGSSTTDSTGGGTPGSSSSQPTTLGTSGDAPGGTDGAEPGADDSMSAGGGCGCTSTRTPWSHSLVMWMLVLLWARRGRSPG